MSTPEASAVLNNPPPDPTADFEAFVAHGVRNAKVIGSPAYPWTDEQLRERVIAEHRRAFNPPGVARQMGAIRADGDRNVPALAGLKRARRRPARRRRPAEDLQPVGGEATAAAIPGAELRMIPGMGHDLPPSLYDTFACRAPSPPAASRAKTTA